MESKQQRVIKRFHICFYEDADKVFVSGKTYNSRTIDGAIKMFIKDVKTPDKSLIKYVAEMDEYKM